MTLSKDAGPMGPASFDLVIFDCDGVLVDSERLAVRMGLRALSELGWPGSEEEYVERFSGRSDASFREELRLLFGERIVEGWLDAVNERLRQTLATELTAVEGVVEALDVITIPNCVASSSTHDHLKLTLGLTGLYRRFEGRIYSATEVARGKPAPDLFLYAAARLGVHPERCAVVEDSAHGVAAARAAGMRVFAFAGGVTPRSRLEGPLTTVFDTMRELPGLLAGG